MTRLMSVALTRDAVIERRKTVTRRLGWATLTPGTPWERDVVLTYHEADQ